MLLPLSAVSVNAQIKNAAQFIEIGKMVFSSAEASLTKGYWHQFETGKMDTLTYVRWVPKVADNNNVGDNIMCFFGKKNSYINYVTFQTMKKSTIDGYKKEVATIGYKLVDKSDKPDQKREVFSNGKVNVTFVEGRERKTDPVSYMIGVKVIAR